MIKGNIKAGLSKFLRGSLQSSGGDIGLCDESFLVVFIGKLEEVVDLLRRFT